MMRYRAIVSLLAGTIGAGYALGQVPDPTRPAIGATAPDAAGGVAAPAESGVQTVIVRPEGKSAAVINGKYVEVGGKVGEKRVLEINESEVVLKGESGREVIKVTPAIDKTMTKKTAAVESRTMGTTGK